MTNLFSIFDPATPNFFSLNWAASLLFVFMTPITLWLVDSRLTNLFKTLILYIYGEFKPILSNSPFVLLITASFFSIIMFNNVTGLLPYVFTASSHLAFTFSLALPAWLALMLYGWLNNTSNLLAHLIPQGTPSALMPFMVLIETVSNLIRPGTLAIRLTANMIAGHLLITLLSTASPLTPILLGPVLSTAQMALSLLELAVAFIQAYVFSVLVTLYAAEVTN